MKQRPAKHRTQRLRARASTMDAAMEFEDYNAEPNMKLSHAFIVVLALHIIAVGGLFAFNKAKAVHASAKAVKQELIASQETSLPTSPEVTGSTHKNIAESVTSKMDATHQAIASSATNSVALQPRLYQVKSGDTLRKIGKALKISTAELQKVNGLSETAVLHVGQELKLPGKGIALAAAGSAVSQAHAATAMKTVASSGSEVGASVGSSGVATGGGSGIPSGSGSQGSVVAAPPLSTEHKASTATTVTSSTSVAPMAVAPAVNSAVSIPGEATPTVAQEVVAQPQPIASASSAPVATSMIEYTIVKGDNPYKIAKRFHVSYDELIKVNNITDPRKIQIGQKLKIPAAKSQKKSS